MEIGIIIIIVVILGYSVFKDILHQQQVKRLETIVFENKICEDKTNILTEDTAGTVEDNYSPDDLIPLTDVSHEELLKAAEEETVEPIIE